MNLHSFAPAAPVASTVFAALSGLLLFGLGLRTTVLRRKLHIYVGDGGNEAVRRASRAHGLAVEHLLLLSFLLVLLEMQGTSRQVIVALGATMLLARVLAAATTLGLLKTGPLGAALSYTLEATLSLWLLVNALHG